MARSETGCRNGPGRRGGELTTVVGFDVPSDKARRKVGEMCSQRVGRHHALQLAGYAILLEEQEGLGAGSIEAGFVYVLPANDVVAVRLDEKARSEFEVALEGIRTMLTKERFPPATRHVGFCPQCEFVNFCGDMW